VQLARDLGVYVDGALTMRTHNHSRTVVMLQRTETDQINHAVSVFTRAKRSRHCSGSQPVGPLQTLFSPVFQPATSSDYSQCSTQLVRLVAGSSRRDHAFSLLRDRHWLPVKQCVEYKLCTESLQ